MTLTLAWVAAPAQATTQTFSFTGAEQIFIVPGGVTSVHVVVVGGSGGTGDAVGGVAAKAIGDLEGLTPGQTLYVEVGGRGKAASGGGEGGFNGGGDGGSPNAGGGGGASDVRTSPRADGLAPDHRLVVAAGGGGGGGNGNETGGGTGGAAGSAGQESGPAEKGGGAGTPTEGGLGGEGCLGSAASGALGLGGTGGDQGEVTGGAGGGGGGGYYGGGGGGGGCIFGGAGGGGGSSLKPPGGALELASLPTPPEVQITYTLVPPSISIVSPTSGVTYTQGQSIAANYSCTPPIGTSVNSCAGPVANGAALDTAVLGQHTFTVNAEDTDGGKSAQSVSYTVAPVVGSGGPGPANPQPPADTTLGSHPKKTIKTDKKKVKVKFTFSATVAGASFKCKLDKGAFAPCTSPKSYKVKLGQHKFSVETVSGGIADPSPATFSFKVKKKQ